MTYDSLLLNYGGGVVGTSQKSKQFGGAALCIGIGGTGVAALAELKRKVYQQLEPDNPNDPIPQYQHIQFLAIDSDETDIKKMKGTGKLDERADFFSIHMPNLKASLERPERIKDNPVMNWMEVDNITELLSPHGAGGIRQVGRFLLLSKASELKNRINAKCNLALQNANPHLDVYIFAGISGGTGSGCFIDTCYIVRQTLQEMGLSGSGNIMGFFFLPDVVTSKTEVAANNAWVNNNNSNGYAAMKELDYLMDLVEERDRFHQFYGSFTIDTQSPPVDLCHLLSAQKADGSKIENGFGYCINVAADYVTAYLAEVAVGGTDNGLTMQGHLSNVNSGVSHLTPSYGAHLCYHILGASNAEIPMSQIATYLAAGYYRRFAQAIGRQTVVVTADKVNEFATKLGITAELIEEKLQEGCGILSLPDVDQGQLRQYGPVPENKAVDPWWTVGEAWKNKASGSIEQHRTALNSPLASPIPSKNTSDSLISRVFVKLCELCCDPSYGPYYAAALLHQSGEDLINYAKGVKKHALEDADSMARAEKGYRQAKAQASITFCNPPLLANRNKLYQEYKQAEEQSYVTANQYNVCIQAAKVADKLQEDLLELDKNYFQPLIRLLDNLADTFREDEAYLNSEKAASQTAYTWRLFELSQIRPHLDKVIEGLTPKQLVQDFLTEVINSPDEWIQNDDGKVGLFVQRYMECTFHQDMNRGLQDYLFLKYPEAGKAEAKLAQIIEERELSQIDQKAVPMFWCNPAYNMTDPNNVFQCSSLSVPLVASVVCTAADNMKKNKREYSIRKTGLKDRIFALRFLSGIPFYAYQGATLLKSYYDKTAGTAAGVGIHLYARTGRGTDGSGDLDWRYFLPTPVPYSLHPEFFDKPNKEQSASQKIGYQGVELYEKGKECGALYLKIGEKGEQSYYLRTSAPLELKEYIRKDFVSETGKLDENKLLKERDRLHKWLDNRYGTDVTKWTALRNDGLKTDDGAIMERVRKDYFLHYPRLQEIVRTEVENWEAVNAALAALDEIEADYKKYDTDLSNYCNLLFFHTLECLNSVGKNVFFDSSTKNRGIGRILYRYQSKDGRNRELILAEKSDYTLADGFDAYRALDPVTEPRRQMDKIAQENGARSSYQPQDAAVAAQLEEMYSAETMETMEREIQVLREEEQARILRFYEGLRLKIAAFAKFFETDDWDKNKGMQGASASAPVPGAAAGYISYNGQTLWWNPQYPNYGFNTQTNSYVALAPRAALFQWKEDKWVPVMTDQQGNLQPQ